MARFYFYDLPPGYDRDPWNRVAEEYHDRDKNGRWVRKGGASKRRGAERKPVSRGHKVISRYVWDRDTVDKNSLMWLKDSLSPKLESETERIIERLPFSDAVKPLKAVGFVGESYIEDIGKYNADEEILYIAHDAFDKNDMGIDEQGIVLGEYAVVGDFLTLFRHEFAHHLLHSMPELGKQWDAFLSNIKNKTKNDMALKISEYAASSSDEFFAEAFAVYMSPYYTKGMLPKRVHAFFESLSEEN